MASSRFLLGCAVAAVLTLAPAATASEVLPGPFRAAVERVVDGDTLSVRVTIWLGQEIAILVRIRGIDAPELHGKCDSERERAAHATAALTRLVEAGSVQLTGVEGDKYFGRVLADVTTEAGEDVGAALLAAGEARAYDGGTRGSWCETGEIEKEGKAQAVVN